MKYLIFAAILFTLTPAFSAEDHGKKETHEKEEPGHDEHADHDEHGEHAEEANPMVGADKGILEANAEHGIKLSPEAEKNFEIKTKPVAKDGRISVDTKSLVTAGVEVNVFRYRGGFYKRIDFNKISQANNQIIISSKDLVAGDFVVTQGLGFLRIAEITAFDGAPEHSH